MIDDDPLAKSAGNAVQRPPMLDALVRKYRRALTRFFERRVDEQTDANDLVQDVFVRLAAMDNLSAIEKPENYIFTAAGNVLRDRARRVAVRGGGGTHQSFDDGPEIVGSDISLDRVLQGRQAITRLESAIRELPERTRDIFVLRVFEGQKMADIAHVVGISTRAVEKHYQRAMIHVAAALEPFRDV